MSPKTEAAPGAGSSGQPASHEVASNRSRSCSTNRHRAASRPLVIVCLETPNFSPIASCVGAGSRIASAANSACRAVQPETNASTAPPIAGSQSARPPITPRMPSSVTIVSLARPSPSSARPEAVNAPPVERLTRDREILSAPPMPMAMRESAVCRAISRARTSTAARKANRGSLRSACQLSPRKNSGLPLTAQRAQLPASPYAEFAVSCAVRSLALGAVVDSTISPVSAA